MDTVLYFATAEGVVTVKGDDSRWEVGPANLKEWRVNEVAARPEEPNVRVRGHAGRWCVAQ